MGSWSRRRSRRAVLATLALGAALALGVSVSTAHANDTAAGGIGGVVYPLASTDIRMRAETVQVICYRDFAEYRVDFEFVNEGDPQIVKLGFPFVVTRSDFMGTAPIGFRAWQDGRPLAVTVGLGVSQQDLINGNAPLGYYLHSAAFPSGETMITVSYLARPTVSSGSRFNEAAPPEFIAAGITGWAASYDYWLHTGAGWKGTIEKSVVRFRFTDSFKGWAVDVPSTAEGAYPGNVTSPECYVKVDGYTYQWVFEDYEPTEANDIILAFTRPNLWLGHEPGTVPPAFGALGTIEDTSGGPAATTAGLAGGQTVEENAGAVWAGAAPGKGGWVRFDIQGNRNLGEIRILPGRTDTLTSFSEYARPKTLRVSLSNGSSMVIGLEDEPSLQRFSLNGLASWVRLEVLDIYPGTKSTDTYISLVDFGNAPAPEFESFTKLLAERTPPTTKPIDSTSLSFPDSVATTSNVVTTLPVVTLPVTTLPTTTTVMESSGQTGIPDDPAEGNETSGRVLWPAIVGTAVGALGLALLAYLIVRLRRGGRAGSA